MRRHTTLAIALVVSLLACRDPNGALDAGSPPTSDATTGLSSAGTSTDASGITGTVGGLAGVCPTVTFTLEGKTITTSAATRYEGVVCSDLKNGARVKVSGATQANGSIAAQTVVIASTVPTTPTTTAVKGTASEVVGTCPVLSLKLEGKTITSNAATRYEGGACADVKNGVVISITGTVQGDGSIVALSIALATPVVSTTTVKGVASEVAGTCPVLSLKLEGKKITTTAATRYEGGACADVKNGSQISVTGTVQADGSIVASSIGITLATAAAPTATVKGVVGDVAGTCPVISFKLEGKKITTTAATRYEGGACADVKNGVIVAATGTVQADGSIQAAVVSVSK